MPASRLGRRAKWSLAGIVVALAIAAAPLLWRAVVVIGLGTANTLDPRGDAYWKLLYLQRYADGDLYQFRFHVPHPVRGWAPTPNLRAFDGVRHESVNAQGLRGTHDFAHDPGKFNVAVLGDSFTYGSEADDAVVWPAVLQERDPRLNVINHGVGGYGIDQMYLMLQEHIGVFKPDLVLLAPIFDDLNRTLLSFREHRKPRFVLDEAGALKLTNTPIGSVAEVYAALRRQYGYLGPRFALAREDAKFALQSRGGAYDAERAALNTRLIEACMRLAHEHGAAFMLVYLAAGPEITDRTHGDKFLPDEEFMHDVAARNQVAFVPTRLYFLASEIPWSTQYRHYQKDEAEFVSRVVFQRIKREKAWRSFEMEHPLPARP